MHWCLPAAIALAVLLTAPPPSPAKERFSGLPEFKAFYEAYPPREGLPGEQERSLLRRYRPRFFLAPGADPFVDFYADYIAEGRLEDSEGKIVSAAVTRDLLNRYRDDPSAIFIHRPRAGPTRAAAYGRVDYDALSLPGGRERLLTFLTYNIVFPRSGLPAGIRGWQRVLMKIVASLDDWHQLDHYVALTIALDGEIPIAVTLQQHNYQRTYILGRGMDLPADDRVAVDAALSSNELYPHSAERVEHRAVSFLTPKSALYLVTGRRRPLLAGRDVTQGTREVKYELEFLPQTDAFYTFRGMLGEPRLIPHRDGPPGADFNTIPSLKPKATALVVFYFRDEGDMEYVDLLRKWMESIGDSPGPALLRRYTGRFLEDLDLTGRELSGASP
jgi:hypothetical protein